MNRMTSIFLTLLSQGAFTCLFFLGFLLDPLLGIIVAGVYFFILGSGLIYTALRKWDIKA